MKSTALKSLVRHAVCLAAGVCLETAVARPVPAPTLLARINGEDPRPLDVFGIVHFSLNTYSDREWGFGDEKPETFDPEAFRADQIVAAARDGGLGGLVIVAKHHNGFCLWPTKTTDYNISKSPFRGGKGDWVREMSEACKKYGLKFGVYVSPWDRNMADYASPSYVDKFHRQVEELLDGSYGEVFEMWFDGANGGDGWYGGAKERRTIPKGYYRFGELFAMVRRLQPKVCIFSGELNDADLRWPGNEQGELSDESRGTVPAYEDPEFPKCRNTGRPDGRYFHQPECDFPLRRGWFYHDSDKGTTRSAAYLLKIYLRTVGNAGCMNVGLAPDRNGRLCNDDVKALKGFRTLRDAMFAHPVTNGPCNVVEMREDVSGGERTDGWRLIADGRTLAEGKSIGCRRLRTLAAAVPAEKIKLEITASDGRPLLRPMRFYAADPKLLEVVAASSTTSGETDTARWMAAGREEGNSPSKSESR